MQHSPLTATLSISTEYSTIEETNSDTMHRYPWYSRFGAGKRPRFHWCFWRCKIVTPGRTRKAAPLVPWEAITAKLAMAGHRTVAVFVVLMLMSYARPSALSPLPSNGVTSSWSLLIASTLHQERRSLDECKKRSARLASDYLAPSHRTRETIKRDVKEQRLSESVVAHFCHEVGNSPSHITASVNWRVDFMQRANRPDQSDPRILTLCAVLHTSCFLLDPRKAIHLIVGLDTLQAKFFVLSQVTSVRCAGVRLVSPR